MRSSRPVEFLPGPAGERALVARLRDGDEMAFRELYEAHAGRLLRILKRILHDDGGLAEEVLQECFVAAFRAIGELRSSASITGWLTRIAVRRGLNARRGESRRSVRDDAFADEETPLPGPDTHDTARRLLFLIQQLEEPKRMTMLLLAEGMGATEIAEVLGERRGTVLARISRTRALLAAQAIELGLVNDIRARGGGR